MAQDQNTTREPKHLLLRDAITRLEQAIESLEALMLKVKDEPSISKAKKCGMMTTSLAQTLEQAPNHIKQLSEQLFKVQAELDDLLF
mgnify:CR=1 FL=1